MKAFAGRIADVDSHEMMPAQEWVKHFGPEAQPLVDYYLEKGEDERDYVNTVSIPGFPGDIEPVTADVVNFKGARAPGAVLPERRIGVMDAMGVERQLLYPTGLGLIAVGLYKSANNNTFMSSITGDRRALAKRWFHLYNEWAVEAQKNGLGRVRPAALLYGDTPEEITQMAKRHVENGFKAVFCLPASELPGGRSPAHPDLDPMWAILAEADCAFTLHLEAEGTPLKENGWRNAPAFEGFLQQGEFNSDPGFLATFHYEYENFLTMMVIGGVLDRHPKLRVGMIEVGAYWIGPLMERLDLWYRFGAKFARREEQGVKGNYRLPHPPSFYIKRNVRVTPYPFEDVAALIERYGLDDVFCFSTDYPHVEGGKDAFSIFFKNLSRLGDKTLEKFFIGNGNFLLPN